jgi:hypothetical protein
MHSTCGFQFLLAYEDSNLDKQNQNLSYYHYTIGQNTANGSAKIKGRGFPAKKFCKPVESAIALASN